MSGEDTTSGDKTLGQIQVGSLSFTHLIIIGAVYSLVVIVFLCLVMRRWALRRARIKHIPRTVMPFLRPGDLPTRQRKHIVNMLVNSHETQLEPVYNEKDHMGYGTIQMGEDTDTRTIHFKTAIAASHWILEAVASSGNHRLKRKPTMTVREYVIGLQKESDGRVSKQLCSFYIEAYERARFSPDEFTAEEYNEFMAKFHKILKCFIKKPGQSESPEKIEEDKVSFGMEGSESRQTQRYKDTDNGHQLIDLEEANRL